MNSRSEYNRCSLPRIRFGDHKDEEEDMETEEERLVIAEIKEMKQRKSEKKMQRLTEEDAKRYDMRKAISEIQNECENGKYIL